MNKNIYAIALIKKELLHIEQKVTCTGYQFKPIYQNNVYLYPNEYFILAHAATEKEARALVTKQLKKSSNYKHNYEFDNINKLYFVVPETENNKDIITNYPLSINLLDEVLSMLCRKE